MGLGDTIVLGNIDNDGTDAEVLSGLSIDGSTIVLQGHGDPDAVTSIRQKATGQGYLEIISGDATQTKIKMTKNEITVDGNTNFTNTVSAYAFIGSTVGGHTGSVTGDVKGSVFGDDSTLLVDAVGSKIIMSNNTTDDLPEGSNNKYFTNGRAIAMTIVFG